jgi:hypothetical protein
VPRLIVTPCVSCGAPLEFDTDTATEARCPYCKNITRVPLPTPPRAPLTPTRHSGGIGVGHVLGALLGGLVLLIAGALALDELFNRSNADHVVDLRTLKEASAHPYIAAQRAAALPDGSVWIACRPDLLCGLDRQGKWIGSVTLPEPPHDRPAGRLRYGGTHAMAGDGTGRLYVSHGKELLEIAVGERRVRGAISVLREGEVAHCLAISPSGSLWLMTSTDDILELDSQRKPRKRLTRPVSQHDARHHGCDSLVVDRNGQLWVSPEGGPAVYVLSADGALVRRHAPGGTAHYAGMAVLANGSVVVGYSDWLEFFSADFEPRDGPKTRRNNPGWSQITDVLLTPDDALIVTTGLGYVARWDRATAQW